MEHRKRRKRSTTTAYCGLLVGSAFLSSLKTFVPTEAFSILHTNVLASSYRSNNQPLHLPSSSRHPMINNKGSNGENENISKDDKTKTELYNSLDLAFGSDEISENDAWEIASVAVTGDKPYVSSVVRSMSPENLAAFQATLDTTTTTTPHTNQQKLDPLWEQVKLEAQHVLQTEPAAGPQLYTLILSHPTLLHALVTIISHEIETELIPATALQKLFLENLHPQQDKRSIDLDIIAAAMRSPSVGTALNAVLYNQGLHALVCHRVSHRLWHAHRTGLSYYLQSTVSRKYSADIHPNATFGSGIYLNCGAGVVVGETAVIQDNVTILQGVTLGGTGKERGDRHPKVGRGVILHDSSTVLGNIEIGDGAVITAKSIVTKAVPALARVSGVPAKVKSFREIGAVDGNANDNGSQEESYDHYYGGDDKAYTVTDTDGDDGSDDQYFATNDSLARNKKLENYFRARYLQHWESDSYKSDSNVSDQKDSRDAAIISDTSDGGYQAGI